MKKLLFFMLTIVSFQAFGQGIKYSQLHPDVAELICDQCDGVDIVQLPGEFQDTTIITVKGQEPDTLLGPCKGLPLCETDVRKVGFEPIDTLYFIEKQTDICGNVCYDTIKQWKNTFCIPDETCTVTTTEYFDSSPSECIVMNDGDFLTFDYDVRLVGDSECSTYTDNNGDKLSIGPAANVVAFSGVNPIGIGQYEITGNPNWYIDILAGTTIKKFDGTFFDFRVEPNGNKIVKDTSCAVVCFPPETKAITTNPDAETGVATIQFELIKLGADLGCGECVEIFLENSGGGVIANFLGKNCDDISTFSNYNPAWFPTSGIIESQGAAIDFDKRQFAIDNGLNAANADNYTIYAVAGGVDCGPTNARCPNKSSKNEEDFICAIIHGGFENGMLTGTTIDNNDGTYSFNDAFQIGSMQLVEGTIFSTAQIDAGGGQGWANGQASTMWYGPNTNCNPSYPFTMNQRDHDWYVDKVLFNGVNYDISNTLVPNTINANTVNPEEIFAAIQTGFYLLQSYTTYQTTNYLDDCTQRLNNWQVIGFCEGTSIEGVTLVSSGGDTVEYDLKYGATQFLNF